MTNGQQPPLGSGPQDHVAALLRAVAGAVPVAGGALAEVVGYVIPSARAKRIEEYLVYLAQRLDEVHTNIAIAKLSSAPSTDLIEEGARQSARALSEDRRKQIARIVAEGIACAELPHIQSKRILRLLDQIDDAELIVLVSYLHRNQHDREFWKKHESILAVHPAALGSTTAEIEADIIHQIGKAHLIQLDLLRSGDRGVEISPSGRLLLQRIGLADDDDV